MLKHASGDLQSNITSTTLLEVHPRGTPGSNETMRIEPCHERVLTIPSAERDCQQLRSGSLSESPCLFPHFLRKNSLLVYRHDHESQQCVAA